ncbi:MAG: hypothetical protein AB1696_23490 [Planctomycetota bacterium]
MQTNPINYESVMAGTITVRGYANEESGTPEGPGGVYTFSVDSFMGTLDVSEYLYYVAIGPMFEGSEIMGGPIRSVQVAKGDLAGEVTSEGGDLDIYRPANTMLRIGGSLTGSVSPAPDEWGVFREDGYAWPLPFYSATLARLDIQFPDFGGSVEEMEKAESRPGVVVGVGERIAMRVAGLGEEGLWEYGNSKLSYDDDRITVYNGPGEDATVIANGYVLDPSQSYEFWVEGKAVGATEIMTLPIDRLVAADYATINVVEAKIEINGSGEWDDVVTEGGAALCKIKLDGWVRPEEYRKTLTLQSEGPGAVEFSADGVLFSDTLEVEASPSGDVFFPRGGRS